MSDARAREPGGVDDHVGVHRAVIGAKRAAVEAERADLGRERRARLESALLQPLDQEVHVDLEHAVLADRDTPCTVREVIGHAGADELEPRRRREPRGLERPARHRIDPLRACAVERTALEREHPQPVLRGHRCDRRPRAACAHHHEIHPIWERALRHSSATYQRVQGSARWLASRAAEPRFARSTARTRFTISATDPARERGSASASRWAARSSASRPRRRPPRPPSAIPVGVSHSGRRFQCQRKSHDRRSVHSEAVVVWAAHQATISFSLSLGAPLRRAPAPHRDRAGGGPPRPR